MEETALKVALDLPRDDQEAVIRLAAENEEVEVIGDEDEDEVWDPLAADEEDVA